MQSYQQQNIYVQNFIRAKHYDFTPAYSELIGRICAVDSAVAMRESCLGFSEEMMAAFKGGGGIYDKVDRICLALRVGLSNELYVLDSCNSVRVSDENRMKRGYRCFVRPGSSLLKLREGEARIFEDAARVTEAFGHNDKPVQRSIGYIAGMGLQSGICLPLHFGGELRGFFFMNSLEQGGFNKMIDEDYAVLSIVAMLGKVLLQGETSSDIEFRSLLQESEVSFEGQLFDEIEFAQALEEIGRWKTSEIWRPKVTAVGECGFIYSPGTVAYLVTKVCARFYGAGSNFPKEISVLHAGDEIVEVRVPINDSSVIPSLEAQRNRARGLNSELKFLRAEIVPGLNHVSIRFPFDPFYREKEGVLYSV